MTDQLPSDVGARIRAARAYAGDLSQEQIEQATGISVSTLHRTERGKRRPKLAELWAIAEVCGLPREFFEIDFAELPAIAYELATRAPLPEDGEYLERQRRRARALGQQLDSSSGRARGAPKPAPAKEPS